MTTTPARATRRRGDELTRAIYLATLAELAETSFDKLSFDRVAARAGTGKGGIYRRWASPADLVLAALTDPLCGFPDTPDPRTGSLRTDLLTLLRGFAHALDEPHGRALRPLMAQRARHPHLYERIRDLVFRPRQEMILGVLRTAVDRGEARPGAVTPRIAALGPRLVLASHMDAGPVPDTETTAIVDEILIPLIRPLSPTP
ncbi:TetR/AcrR family transcriptional regulator [Catenuloplanes atrovinosus]|uniref:AcrR family transcriptional regulator n=1 Tax=Catenuloplanes atrovinosus TaxID=137266 RepID=A0AAE4CAF6_9ACTN|nr:TetR/AcrR family transcriptional regulator [Catenuloplanes atrovinosus]MDR7277003.1 AcrR family transcriptional regulator [Catenuloplanes atrovinosus]